MHEYLDNSQAERYKLKKNTYCFAGNQHVYHKMNRFMNIEIFRKIPEIN